jgi:catechol 2,3-dioxygenase-like lactoylglutathione lyase family enzyme
MGTSLSSIAIDCRDPAALAQFWGEVLGRRLAEDSTSEQVVLLTDDVATTGPLLVFNKVPEARVVKNRLHLDLMSDTFDAETKRLLTLGAERLRDIESDNYRWTTFADIEGNEFDLIAG